MYLEVASGKSRGTTGNLPRRVQEIGVHGDDRPGNLGSGWSDELQVPDLGRPGVQNPEAVFAPCDVEFRLNLTVDHPFVCARRSRSHHLEQHISEEIAGETVALRRRMTVVQVDRGLRPAKTSVIHLVWQAVLETHERRGAVSVENCLSWEFAVEPPNVRRLQVRVKSVERRPSFLEVKDGG